MAIRSVYSALKFCFTSASSSACSDSAISPSMLSGVAMGGGGGGDGGGGGGGATPGGKGAPVGRADRSLDVVFRMRHQPQHVAALAQNSGNRVGRAVDIPARIELAVRPHIAERHPSLALQPRHGFAVGDVVALAMGDRDADHLAGVVAAGERCVRALDP